MIGPREFLRNQIMYRMEEEEQLKRDWGQGRLDHYMAQIALEVRSVNRQIVVGFTALGVLKDRTGEWTDLTLEQYMFDFLQEAKKRREEEEAKQQAFLDAMTDEEFAAYKKEWNRKKVEKSMLAWGAGLGMDPDLLDEEINYGH